MARLQTWLEIASTLRDMLRDLRRWARSLKHDIGALWLAARNSLTPWYAKAVAGGVAAYALSPIDLIPDFIPVLGYLDDLILVPLGIALAVRLIPPPLFNEFREAATLRSKHPASKLAVVVVISVWVISLAATAWWVWPLVCERAGAWRDQCSSVRADNGPPPVDECADHRARRICSSMHRPDTHAAAYRARSR